MGLTIRYFALCTFSLFTYIECISQEISFDDIFPIIQNNCTPCHQTNQIGPMPFTNYDEISAYGQMIQYVTGIRYMPPYLPGGEHGLFKEDRRLSQDEIDKISQWVTAGMPAGRGDVPEGNSKDLLSAFEADAVYSMSDSFEQYGVYYDQYRVFMVPTNLPTDTFVSAIEFLPGNTSIVRNASISVAVDSAFQRWDTWDPGQGYFSFGEVGFVPFESRWYTWYPNKKATIFNADQVKFLPKDAVLIFHIHYGPTNTKQKDRSQIRLKFTSKQSKSIVTSMPLINPAVYSKPRNEIAADEKIKIHAKINIPFGIKLTGLMPHGHLLCRDWEVFVKKENPMSSQELLRIEDWDFKWRQQYHFNTPVLLHKGDDLHVLATYDNTSQNILNPSDPPRTMSWGKRMFEEMMMVYVEFESLGDKLSHDLRLYKNATLTDNNQFSFSFYLSEPTTLSALLCDMSNEVINEIFVDKRINQGNNMFDLNFSKLPKGNYVIRFEDERGGLVDQRIISYVDGHVFGSFK